MQLAPIDPPEIDRLLWQDFCGDEGVESVGWDIGANGGQSLQHMLARFDRVIAFEPAEECQSLLGAWYTNHSDRLVICPIAVSDVDGAVELLAVPDKIATGQLVTDAIKDMEWDADDPAAFIRQVPCQTIDSLSTVHGSPDFMKIDVEGHEMSVLRGAKRLLAENPPDMLIEFHATELYHQCIELLTAAKYTITTVRHPHYAPGSDFWHMHGWLRCFAP